MNGREALAEMRRRHVKNPYSEHCLWDSEVWPCNAKEVLDSLPNGLDVERLARGLPAVSHVLWSRSQSGDHRQVWFDEDILRHFHEWAEDTAEAIAREYEREP